MPEEYIVFPVRGLSENYAFGLQEPGTTREAENMRAINPVNGRIMGAQRAGITNHSDTQVNVTNKIQDLQVIGYDNRAVKWSGLENEVSQPEAFDDAYWTKVNGLTTNAANSRVAPDGRVTADRLTVGAGLGAIYRDFDSTSEWLTNGASAFFSLYTRLRESSTNDPRGLITVFHLGTNAKRNQVRILGSSDPPVLEFRSNTGDDWRDVNTNDPVIFESAEEGYFRIGVGNTLDTSLSNTLRAEYQPISTTGADTGSVWAWGAQFEEGTNAGEYTYLNATTLPSKKGAVNVQTDQFGNVYVLDENANITKFNPDLSQRWTIALPLTDQSHVVRALHIDRFGCVYAAVSEGGRQSRASLWKYVQSPDDEYELWWTVEVGWYIEEIKNFQGALYTAQNNEGTKKSRIAVYDQILSRNPRVSWETGDIPVAYPIRGMDLNSVGDVLVACDEPVGSTAGELFRLTAGTRGAPRVFLPTAIEASVEEILHPTGDETAAGGGLPFAANARLWAHYRAGDIDTNDVEGEFKEGAKVLTWRDISGNNRDLTIPSDSESPTLSLFGGPGGKAAVVFNGSNQAFESKVNGGTARPNRDQQKTVLPGYDESIWYACMMVRPIAQSNQTCVLSQQNTGTNAFEFGFWANRDEGSNISNSAIGQFSVYDDTTNSQDNATGTDAHPASGSFTNTLNNAVIVSYVNNGDVPSPGSQYSVFRLNGTNVEISYNSADFSTSNARSYVGRDASGSYYFKGDISEIIVISGADSASWATGQAGSGEDNYVLSDTTPNTNGTGVPGALESTEGYLAYSYGMYTLLPGGASATNQHHFGLDSNGFAKGPPSLQTNVSEPIVANSAIGQSFLKYPFVAKISSENGSFKWLVNENTTNMTASNSGAVGYGVVVDGLDNVLSIGPDASATNATNAVRKIKDNGDTASVTGSNTWVVAWGGEFPEYKTPRLATDVSNNLYVPMFNANLGNAVRIYSGTNGTLLNGFPLPDGNPDAYAVAVDPFVPDYSTDISPHRAPNIYIATDNMDDETIEVIHKVPIVKSAQTGSSPRTFKLIATAGRLIRDVSDSSSYTTPTGAVGAVPLLARYVQSAELNERLYYVGGQGVPSIYNPRSNEVVKLKATKGRIPEGARLVEGWRGRLVLGRTYNEPQNWFMSRRDDPTDWEFVPFQPTETQAVAGNDTEAGKFPDILNTLVPWSEDILIFGGDKSIYQMSGDPAAGGRFDLITDKTGMSFGRPWTKDPNGILYFLGSRGGLYRMTPGSIPERLSVNRIERRLQDLNFANYYARLEYNWRDEGVHILLIPYGAGGTQVENYFYEIKTDSFWADTFGTTTSTGVQPTSVTVLDGDDPTDRILFFGCEDGRIRKWDKDAVDDGGGAIDSFVTIDLPRTPGTETIYKGLTAILGHSQNGCTYGLHVGQNPDNLGVAVHNEKLVPGRNNTKWNRARGSHGWLKLRNAQQGHSWSVEEIIMEADPAGRARQRSD